MLLESLFLIFFPMKRKNVFKILCLAIAALFLSCTKKNQLAEYESIKLLGIQGNRLHQVVYDYDIENPDFFESKVDLISLYVLSNDFEKAWEYLKRAEFLENKSISKEYLCNYYGLKASILLKQKKFDESLSCCRKAMSIKKIGAKYGFLEGQILFAMGDKEMAFHSLDKVFKNNRDNASLEDKKLYSVLLAEKQKYEESISLLNHLFEEGEYFYGLGQMTSNVYEKKGMIFESIVSACLDYEYASCFFENDNRQFLRNLQALKIKYEGKPEAPEVNRAIGFITASIKNIGNVEDLKETDPLICRYLKIKNKVLSNTIDTGDLEALLSLKSSFEKFPSYHYLVAECVKKQNLNIKPTECYESILNISSKNKYSDYARSGIGKQLGFNESDSKKILSFSEIKRIVERLNLEKDKEALDLICKLFSLPDNKYVFFAEEYIKRNIRNENALKELRERYTSTTGKIRERLDYVINQ